MSDTEEEVLATELNRIGPCIAVGIPGERLPPIGAARMYFEEHEWQANVEDLIKRSELVLMRAGITQGFLFELQLAVRFLDPKKLIIVFPAYGLREFREAANTVLPKMLALPSFPPPRISGTSLVGIVHFESDWSPKILPLSEVGDTLTESFETVVTRYSNYGVI